MIIESSVKRTVAAYVAHLALDSHGHTPDAHCSKAVPTVDETEQQERCNNPSYLHRLDGQISDDGEAQMGQGGPWQTDGLTHYVRTGTEGRLCYERNPSVGRRGGETRMTFGTFA